jgi:hypothetical protein
VDRGAHQAWEVGVSRQLQFWYWIAINVAADAATRTLMASFETSNREMQTCGAQPRHILAGTVKGSRGHRGHARSEHHCVT